MNVSHKLMKFQLVRWCSGSTAESCFRNPGSITTSACWELMKVMLPDDASIWNCGLRLLVSQPSHKVYHHYQLCFPTFVERSCLTFSSKQLTIIYLINFSVTVLNDFIRLEQKSMSNPSQYKVVIKT